MALALALAVIAIRFAERPATPPAVDLALLEKKLGEIPGVVGVHDLHVWTITWARRHERPSGAG